MNTKNLQHILLVVTLALLLGVVGVRPIAADGPTTITYIYDDAGRLIRAAYSDGTVISYAYDAAGNLLTRIVERDFKIYLPLVLRNYTD
jgi:YD repeat-containing protein